MHREAPYRSCELPLIERCAPVVPRAHAPRILHAGSLTRHTFAPRLPTRPWLDLADAAERRFVDVYGTDVRRGEGPCHSYRMEAALADAVACAASALHDMALRATGAVLRRDDLLRRFGVPEELWPRLRRSFATEPHTVSGRFDLGFDGRFLKMFEYNADSASTLLECGVVQTKWADAVGLGEVGRSPGEDAEALLVAAFRQAGVTGRVHFLVDTDPEEAYTALFVARCARQAGLDTRLCVGLEDLTYRHGRLVDGEGVPVTTVWKTWMWETAFADYRAAREARPAGTRPVDGARPRLSDVLFADGIRVFEPLWKAIPSNKAILPVLSEMFPGHPNLLHADWTVTDVLHASGYASKPVSGRCGESIVLSDASGATLDASAGRFGDRDVVYQELFRLPDYDGHYATLGAWILGGVFGGIGIREDASRITSVDSPVVALRVADVPAWSRPRLAWSAPERRATLSASE